MPPLPILKVRAIVHKLEAHGFHIVRKRGKGSHRFIQHLDGRTTTVSGNDSDDVPRGRLAKILRDTGLSIDELIGGS